MDAMLHVDSFVLLHSFFNKDSCGAGYTDGSACVRKLL